MAFSSIMAAALKERPVERLAPLGCRSYFNDGFSLHTKKSVGQVRSVLWQHGLVPHQVCKSRKAGCVWVSLEEAYCDDLAGILKLLQEVVRGLNKNSQAITKRSKK